MQVSQSMISFTDKVNINGEMEKYTQADGFKECNMEMANFQQVIKQIQVNGSMENEIKIGLK